MADHDFRQDLTDKIIAALESGTAPWQKPWDGSAGGFFPINPTTGKAYRGGNALQLMGQGYEDNRWCTFNQANENGWKIRKGEKATWIEYWKWSEKSKEIDEETGKEVEVSIEKTRPSVFYAKVFNLSQMDNVPELVRTAPAWDPLEMAENAIIKSQANIIHDQANRAYYSSSIDEIHLPPRTSFPSAEKYYATTLHEIGHWTGHESRLNRGLGNVFGSPEYAKEELRAELASLFLADRLGIPFEFEQHASYVGSWIKALKEDKHEIFKAARDAEKIVDHVMDLALQKTVEVEKVVLKEESVAKSKIYLHVPFVERGEAKSLGAKWDGDNKAWYVPSGVDVRTFHKWENPRDSLDAVREFEDAIRSAGLILDGAPIMDGKWHYVHVEGGRLKEKQGSYKATLDDAVPNGFIKNLYDDTRSRGWKFQTVGLDASKVAELDHQAKENAAKREAEDLKEKLRIAEYSQSYVNKCPDIEETFPHRYLTVAKEVKAYSLKHDVDFNKNSLIVIPLRDIDGKVWSYQTINEDGEKRYKAGGRKTGCFHLIGEFDPHKPCVVMEGYATGATAHEATGVAVAVAFDSTNILEVAKAIKAAGKASEIVIGGDDDRFIKCTVGWTPEGKYIHSNAAVNEGALPNAGREKAFEAAEAVQGFAVFPKFKDSDYKGTDFNDLKKAEGIKTVRSQLSFLTERQNALTL